ncbi:MAG: hypothetical protein VKK04_22540 [Synechococcales bacterium]|nr:hypothetical protein [Synechococcales bacterium]
MMNRVSRRAAALPVWVCLAMGAGALTGCLDNTIATETTAAIDPNRREVIENFRTNCHFVEVYRLNGSLRMEVLPRAQECQVVPGSDLRARSQEGTENISYAWEEDGIRVQAIVPRGEGRSTLEFIGDSVEPNGRLVELEESSGTSPDPVPDEQTYREGYNLGFQAGVRRGRSDRNQNLGYNPSGAFPGSGQSDRPSYDQGYEDGFFAGYETGYYALGDISIPNPPAAVALVCRGIVGNSDFTVFYSQEAGFSRVDIRPRTSSALLTARLSYIGNNQDGQPIWRGAIAGMADVTVVHLATGTPQVGDRVLISYDGQRSTGVCQQQSIGGLW